MPLTNRVTPYGRIISTAARGTLMGNRGGMMHRLDKTLGPRQWVNKTWITCRLSFKGRWREVMGPNSYTELFFLDEATSFAAGHRPCYECRRHDALAYAEFWADAHGTSGMRAKAGQMDEQLHRERLTTDGQKGTFRAEIGSLPTGTMVLLDERCWLVIAGRLFLWTPEGYSGVRDIAPETVAHVLTPQSTVEVFRAGYDADVHGSALEHM
jgi:hypothetical protein